MIYYVLYFILLFNLYLQKKYEMSTIINIKLSQEQSIVLWDLLYRINSKQVFNTFFEDQSEQRILWDLESILEKETSNIFSGDYLEDLTKARESIRDKN